MAALEPLFIDGPAGRLFLVHHYPEGGQAARAVVVLPAFFEEMNKSRRQVALAARELADRGFGVVVPDVRGTGDSDGEFADATVSGFAEDLGAIVEHARRLGYRDIDFLALRGGALLAGPLSGQLSAGRARLVAWQPVTSGKTMINQFLRLKAAAGLMGDGAGVSVRELRERLAAGDSVEVAGYTLSAEFVAQVDALEFSQLSGVSEVDWVQIGRADDTPPPAARRVLEALASGDVPCRYRSIAGDPFWATAEIATVPGLSELTADLLGERE